MKRTISAFCLSLILATPIIARAYDGPFGLKEGLSIAELKQIVPDLSKTKSANVYKSATTPKPYPEAQGYYFFVTENAGLCRVSMTVDVDNVNSFGDQLKTALNVLASALKGKYGKPTYSIDGVQKGSLWTEKRYWMMGLVKEERTLELSWFDASGTTEKERKKSKRTYPDLPNNISYISLNANALNSTSGWVSLQYTFKNIDSCVAEEKAQANSGL